MSFLLVCYLLTHKNDTRRCNGWASVVSNHGPQSYQDCALTN